MVCENDHQGDEIEQRIREREREAKEKKFIHSRQESRETQDGSGARYRQAWPGIPAYLLLLAQISTQVYCSALSQVGARQRWCICVRRPCLTEVKSVGNVKARTGTNSCAHVRLHYVHNH